ncbi:MAG: DUF4340 domain-containing protein [Methylophilus sp.]|nr:DUF4340 domain-containing protein [Methylophilus sp.]
MKKRWLLNLLLLTLVVGIALFLHFRPQDEVQSAKDFEVSALKMADFTNVKVEFPAQAPVAFEKVDGFWRMTAPYKSRADQMSVQRILSIIAARTKVKLPATDLTKYGLDNPLLKLKLTDAGATHEFAFGTYNPVTEEQYVGFKDAVYLLPGSYSEAASTQPIELVDKRPLTVAEAKQIVGLDLGRLEQWEEIRLNVDVDDQGKWQVSAPKAKPTQNEMNEWLEFSWKQSQATSVEFYTPDRKATYPSFELKLKNGKKVHFDKLQESPEYLLARPDEGIIYHFPNDVGFTMVNPPINLQ